METTSAGSPPQRRADLRTPVRIPAAVFSHHFSAPVEIECHDLSPGGMYLAADLLLAPGERVLVAFIPPGTWHRILVDAEVVRARGGLAPGMGLRFDRLLQLDGKILRSALEHRRVDATTGVTRDGAWRS